MVTYIGQINLQYRLTLILRAEGTTNDSQTVLSQYSCDVYEWTSVVLCCLLSRVIMTQLMYHLADVTCVRSTKMVRNLEKGCYQERGSELFTAVPGLVEKKVQVQTRKRPKAQERSVLAKNCCNWNRWCALSRFSGDAHF